MSSIKFYDENYLMNEELTDDDLKCLLGDHQLIYSLIALMFKISNHHLSNKEITKIVQNDDKWVYKYFWTKKQHDQFEKMLFKIFRNVYWYSEKEIPSHVQMWMIYYGLSIKGNNINQ